MSIFPLPIFERDADPAHRDVDATAYAELKAPSSIVVRFGAMRMIGEFPHRGEAKPGCGSKLVVRTHRGTELGEMLTTTCGNGGCGKSVSRDEVRSYIEASGGKDYPFHADGEVLRVATMDDLAAWERISMEWGARTLAAKQAAIALGMPVRLVQLEPLLGDEQVIAWVHPTVEGEIDLAPLKAALASTIGRPAQWQVIGARDEARLVADREKCGQSVCCSTFLKVLKPVSIKHAKVQGHTLDPLKISGRCGRLMCCLRYEDQTYAELAAKLPKRGTVVGTADGVGTVVETRTLVQLVLVRLHATGQDIALPVEDLLPPEQAPQPSAPPAPPAGDQRPGVSGGKRPRRDGPRGDGHGGKRSGDRR
jgi:cell fate regulator YaaT (PSP1 superfamily)